MKKTLIALALLSATSAVSAATTGTPVTALLGDGAFNFAFELPGAHVWSGPLDMDTDGVLVSNAFDFNGSSVDIKAMGDGTGLHGEINGGTLSLNFENFGIVFNGGDISLSSPLVTIDSFDPTTLTFAATWTPMSPLGATTWTMSGTVGAEVSPVPVPAAVWLFGSGILGLFGIVRRKRSS